MGYVKDTDISQFIPPSLIMANEGTWTPTASAGVVSNNRTAAGGACTVIVPLNPLPGSNDKLLGAKIKSVDVWYEISVAAASDFASCSISKQVLPANATAHSVTTPAVTIDADHDSAAERKTLAKHKMNVALDTEEFVADDIAYYLQMVITCAATSVLKIYGAQINYDLVL